MTARWTLPLLALSTLATVTFADQGAGTKYSTPKPPPTQPRAMALTSALVGGADSCVTPDVIVGGGPFLFDNTVATTGLEGQAEGLCTFFGFTTVDQDVWFKWTATSSGILSVNTCGLSAVDTKIAIYQATSCPTAGSAIGCNDDACPGFQTTAQATVVAGQDYLIQLGTYPGAGGGTGTFTCSVSSALPNDECASALALTGAGPFLYDTSTATRSAQGQNNSRCFIFNTSVIDFDVWYQWTAPSTGWFAVNGCVGGLHDMKMAVYAGAGCPTTEPLGCDDDMCGAVGGPAKAPFFATAGQAYTIQLGSYPGQAGAPGQFTIDPFTPAAADECTAPAAVTGAGPYAWDQLNATTGFVGQDELNCAGEMITYDLWYSWTSNCTGTVTVTLCNQTGNDTKLAVYAGGGCPTAQTSIVCNDDFCLAGGPSQVTFGATAGQTYLIQIGSWPGEIPGSGTFSITTSCPIAPGAPYCSGDGSSTACPCGNVGAAGNGCASSINVAGANLTATGTASLAADSVVLAGSGMPNSNALFFQGSTQIASPFGDGLRCVGGTVVRLGTKLNAAGSSQYPAAGDLAVSVRGQVTLPGVRNYQVWYRNAAAFCTAATFNLTNGYTITWNP
jgi:hypothetical protein